MKAQSELCAHGLQKVSELIPLILAELRPLYKEEFERLFSPAEEYVDDYVDYRITASAAYLLGKCLRYYTGQRRIRVTKTTQKLVKARHDRIMQSYWVGDKLMGEKLPKVKERVKRLNLTVKR